MEKSKDQIFSLSLTELSFILTFIFILITSLMVYEKTKKNEELQVKLDAIENIRNVLLEFDKAKEMLNKSLEQFNNNNTDPEGVISKLIAESKKQNKIDQLMKLLEEQEVQISNLSEIQSILKESKNSGQDKLDFLIAFSKELNNQNEILSSIPGKDKKEKIIYLIENHKNSKQTTDNNKIMSAQIEELSAKIKDLEEKETQAAKLMQALESSSNFTKLAGDSTQDKIARIIESQKENNDLKGQIQFLKNRLEANGGMDFPPCWADENGKIQFLFNVDLKEDNLNIARAWPDSREKDALNLPNIKEIISKPSNDYPNFIKSVKLISDLSRQQNCRHYVRIKNSINSAIVSDRRRLSIEEHFYKVETRR